ncbi:cell wall synthesis protein [Histoplasma capsulatum G186AR]|uniref:Cell wall synthesis protein n=2 Tax=Ajellomyces capsulatus TaxID=5037 RepID=C0ND43_AJECG|nr:cell wall synthesis protein [Histoplasma capsulatum G186AR]EEH11584.1 cell wall synthesis protein [Histoplasma capsulatum G186AR]KAG5302576.1 cell wall synthesis protein [Histoplasma capsulatum]QSS72024.1 cell wall synthesis protein [Histoplasma capsulatum G186AR]
MKLAISVVLTVAAAGSLAAAQSHRHNHHRHPHVKRSPDPTDVVVVPGPTVYAYEFEGELISKSQACDGIQEGALQWADPDNAKNACDPQPSVTPPKAAEFYEKPTTTHPAPSASSDPPKDQGPNLDLPEVKLPLPIPKAPSPPQSGAGVEQDFPDGQISCSNFPAEYGAISLDWLGLGGWSGIQYVTVQGSSVTDIRTGIHGDKCEDGAMCSYACGPGYQKSQWPSTQGSTGQSVGGLKCSGGKLYLTNPGLSKKLCMKGVGGVQVKNTMSQVVAVCRTDYPGTESETVPLSVGGGSITELTCPDSGNYYTWQGKGTSAQYYVNPKGVTIQEGCQWGDGSRPIGNFAPINLGVGRSDGTIFLSIFQNAPTTNAKLDFSIKIEGSNLSGACSYKNGMFHDATGSNPNGCTVGVTGGTATYVFSD